MSLLNILLFNEFKNKDIKILNKDMTRFKIGVRKLCPLKKKFVEPSISK